MTSQIKAGVADHLATSPLTSNLGSVVVGAGLALANTATDNNERLVGLAFIIVGLLFVAYRAKK